jgi:hypothetical protein
LRNISKTTSKTRPFLPLALRDIRIKALAWNIWFTSIITHTKRRKANGECWSSIAMGVMSQNLSWCTAGSTKSFLFSFHRTAHTFFNLFILIFFSLLSTGTKSIFKRRFSTETANTQKSTS